MVEVAHEVVAVPGQALFLDGPVEPLDVGVPLRVPRVVPEVRDGGCGKHGVEDAVELAPVVRLDVAKWEGGHRLEFPQEVRGALRRAGRVAPSESEAAHEVNGSQGVASAPVHNRHDRVQLEEIAGEVGLVALPTSFLGSLPALLQEFPRQGAHSKAARIRQPSGSLEVSQDPAHRRDGRDPEVVVTADGGEQWPELLFAQPGVLRPETDDRCCEPVVHHTVTFPDRRGHPRGSLPRVELPLPAEQGCP